MESEVKPRDRFSFGVQPSPGLASSPATSVVRIDVAESSISHHGRIGPLVDPDEHLRVGSLTSLRREGARRLDFRYDPSTERALVEVDPAQIHTGGPSEARSLTILVDMGATWGSTPTPSEAEVGIMGPLVALETFVLPNSTELAAIQQDVQLGRLEVTTIGNQDVFLILDGDQRGVVHVTSYEVTNEDYDAQLTPLRATIQITFQPAGPPTP